MFLSIFSNNKCSKYDAQDARITHADLMQGGDLVFYVSKDPRKPKQSSDASTQLLYAGQTQTLRRAIPDFAPTKTLHISYTLNQQFRTWPLVYGWQGDTLVVTCKEAQYVLSRSVVENATGFCWDIPTDGAVYQSQGTVAFISRQAMDHLRQKGFFLYDDITWRSQDDSGMEKIHVRADIDQTDMWIEYDRTLGLYLVTEMRNNPLGIDWRLMR